LRNIDYILKTVKFYRYGKDQVNSLRKFRSPDLVAREKNRIQQLRHLVEYIADIIKYTNATVVE